MKLFCIILMSIWPAAAFGQQTIDSTLPSKPIAQAQGPATEGESKRIFGIIPNYRTSPSLDHYQPLSAKQKLNVAQQDAFDRGTFVLAAAFAGISQLTTADRSFGQGGAGYGHYLGTSYADLVIGDYFTEAIFPTLLHQDPRYFRRGIGKPITRLRYAVGQIFMTHSDYGSSQFNYSEILGNATAVAISAAYYPEARDSASAVSKLGMQLGVDMASNVLREFWPEIVHRFSKRRKTST
jgi:hypothetical protein